MSEHSHSTRDQAADDLTFYGEGLDLSPRPAPTAHEAFILAYERIRSLARIARAPAVVVAVVTPQLRLLDAALVEDARALIVGRHSRCGLRVPARDIALRQAALLVVHEGDATVTRVWDLNTGAPFVTEDGQPSAALITSGPCYFSLQGHAFWIVPASVAMTWRGLADEAWAALPRRVLIDRRPAEATPGRRREALPTEPPSARSRARDAETSYVTLVGAPLVLGDPEDIEIGWGALRLEHGPRRRLHHVSAERLERGVLVGRYERCGLAVDHDQREISRVHALLVKVGADVWAIDTASSNGLWRGRIPVEADVLADVDALALGKGATLSWERQRHPEA